MTVTDHNFTNSNALAEKLAKTVAHILNEDLQIEGRALLAVSGGSTPKLFLQNLSQLEIDWPGVTVTLVDERWVADTHPRSNARLVQENLLINKAKSAQFFPLYKNGQTPEDGLQMLEDEFRNLSLRFSAVILGMGTDGHTASFFPQGSYLTEALDLENRHSFSTMTAPGAGEARITFTLAALLKTKWLGLHIEGNEKQTVLGHAQKDGLITDMPIRAVLRQTLADVSIFWCPNTKTNTDTEHT